MPYPRTLETDRLSMRPWREDDHDAFLAVWADPGVAASLRPGTPSDPARAEERLQSHVAHWADHGFGLWAATERSTGEVAGWTGAWYPDMIPALLGEIEVAWTLRRRFWGRGLATEGARAAMAAAAAHLAPPRLISIIAPANERSTAVATRLGMSRAETAFHPGAGIDVLVYELASASSAGSSRGASPHSTSSR